jgi:1-acyl-sn-glycerol-3-phosphate acyltransferase
VALEPTYQLARWLLKPFLSSWFSWTLEGEENIPKKGPLILAMNHISYLDPLAAAYLVDKVGRRPRFLAKAELFQDKRIGWILKGAGQIEVHRGTREAPMALDRAYAALDAGEVVVVFPEGTITNDPDLNPMEAKSGLARLALRTKVPIVPSAVWGSANVWPKGYEKHWRPRQDILIRVGEPMRVSGDPDSPEDWKRVGAEVMDRIAVLLASLRPAVPDRRRPKRSAA